ncbi:hypothetical protein DYH09_12275 [bacterium CPR1]|nr:hypothetical protein [bacterium CPR1]
MATGSVQDLVARLRSGLSGTRRESVAPRASVRLQEGDLRHVAILFLDVRGFTGLAEQLAPDELSLFIHQTVFQSFSAAIAEHRGVVLQFLGDAIYAIFPPAQARIDPREMACRAALAILHQVEAIQPICREAQLDIAVRIGVNYGRIALSRVSVGERLEWTGAGDAINVAKRLEQLSPANSVLVLDELARAMADRFEFIPFGRHQLKGKSEERDLFVLGPARVDLVQTDSVPTTPLVGRARELEALRDWNGRGSSVLEGEAGMAACRGWEESGAVDVLEALLQGHGDEELDPRARSLQLQLAFQSFFQAAGREAERRGQRLTLRLEDAQWIDDGSLEVLSFLYEQEAPLPLIMTSRTPVEWMTPSLAMRLAPLGPEDTRQLLLELLGEPVEPATQEAFLDRAGGNPFVLGELVAHAREQRALSFGPQGLELTSRGLDELPASLQGAVLSRVDRLEARLKTVLQMAAVLGREFSRFNLERVCRGAGIELTDQSERLEKEGFLTRSSRPRTGWSDAGELFVFANGLVQEVVEDSLLVQNRRLLHRLALEALEPEHAASPGRLAYHAEQAQDWGRALTYHAAQARAAYEGSHFKATLSALEGAEAALARFTGAALEHSRLELLLLRLETEEQLSHFDQALELADRGLSGAGAYPELALRFAARRGLVLLRKSRLEEAEACLGEVLARSPQGRWLADVQYALGSVDYDLARYQEAQAHFVAARAAAVAAGDRRREALALRSLAFAALARGEVETATTYLEAARDLAHQLQDVRMEGNLVGSLGLAQQDAGQLEEACAAFRTALECSQRCHDLANQSIWWVNLGAALLKLNQLQEAWQAFERSLELAGRAGYPAVEVEARLGAAGVLRARGQNQEAAREASQAAEQASQIGQPALEEQARQLLATLI